MSIFRNMNEPGSNSIVDLPAYSTLPEDTRKAVNNRYEEVYNNNQRMGIRIAQGMAFEAAKAMCESAAKVETNKCPRCYTHPVEPGKALCKHCVYWASKPKSVKEDEDGDTYAGGDDADVSERMDNYLATKDALVGIAEDEIVEDFSKIANGDHVTYKTPQGQDRKGKVVMRSSHGGWVLNTGGKHGTPGLVDKDNYVKHTAARKKKISEAEGDPEDGGAKEIQYKNHADKCPDCGHSKPCDCECPVPGAVEKEKAARKTGLDEADSRKFSHEDFLPAIKSHGYEYKSTEKGKRNTHVFTHPKTGHSVNLFSNSSGGGNAEASHSEGGMSNNPKSFANILAGHSKSTNEDFDLIAAAAGYIQSRSEIVGLTESTNKEPKKKWKVIDLTSSRHVGDVESHTKDGAQKLATKKHGRFHTVREHEPESK